MAAYAARMQSQYGINPPLESMGREQGAGGKRHRKRGRGSLRAKFSPLLLAPEPPCLISRRPHPQNMKVEIIIGRVWTQMKQTVFLGGSGLNITLS